LAPSQSSYLTIFTDQLLYDPVVLGGIGPHWVATTS
jgi:hypothetical protein